MTIFLPSGNSLRAARATQWIVSPPVLIVRSTCAVLGRIGSKTSFIFLTISCPGSWACALTGKVAQRQVTRTITRTYMIDLLLFVSAGSDVPCTSIALFSDMTHLLCNHRSEEHTSELQSLRHLVCRLLLEKKKTNNSIA